MSFRRSAAAAALLILVALWRVHATYAIFSQTTDEPLHIAAGFDWWHGKLDFDLEHPPLARILFGFSSAIVERYPDPGPGWVGRGNALLINDHRYVQNLARARLPNLFFLAILIAVVWRWAARDYGPTVGVIAAAIVGGLPPILGHAGVATTDLALASMFALASYSLCRYLHAPTIARAAILGLAIGLGLSAKFSFLFYFPIAVVVLSAGHLLEAKWKFDWSATLLPLVITMAIAAALVAIVYRFQPSHFVAGIRLLQEHAQRGHPSYLFGRVSADGWWYYFPVSLFFKTPLALFVLVAAGARRAAPQASLALALLLAVLPATLNLGIRHILVLYVPLAIVAAVGAATLWRRSRLAVVIVASWFALATTLAHPDYIAYFNEAAGREPGRILVDSNLDWGQDVLRLIELTNDWHIPTIGVVLAGTAPFDHIGLPPRFDVHSMKPAHGWIAVSEEAYRLERLKGGWAWLRGHDYVRIGKSIRLYNVP